MEEMVTIPKKEYEELKKKAGLVRESDVKKRLKATLADVRSGRVSEF